MTRALVLGLEVVKADGTVLEMLSPLHKDNTGYDLKQLFIGSEGTLGVITAATLRLFAKPDVSVTALAAVPSPQAALTLLGAMQARTGGMLSAFELIPRIALEFVHAAYRRHPRSSRSFIALVCADGSHRRGATHTLPPASRTVGHRDRGRCSDGCGGGRQRGASRGVVETARKHFGSPRSVRGLSIKHDISVPVAAIPDFLARATPAVLALGAGGAPPSASAIWATATLHSISMGRAAVTIRLPGAMGRGAAMRARHRQGVRRFDQRRTRHRGDEGAATAALQEPRGTGCDARNQARLRSEKPFSIREN